MKLFKKIIKFTAKNFIHMLPSSIQRKVVLKKYIEKDISPLEDLRIKIATTENEALDGLNILYEAYEHKELTKKNVYQTHVTKYHALPTTIIIVAYLKDRPIGTMSLFMDSELGLPMEHYWDISDKRFNYKFILEISSLAVIPEFQKKSGKILLPMIAFSLRYMQHRKIRAFFITVHPDAILFYKHIFGFKLLDKKVVHYKNANGAKAMGLYSSLKELIDNMQSAYISRTESLYHYFFEKKFHDTFDYIVPNYDDGIPFIHSKDNFQKLFSKIIQINEVLNLQEKISLSTMVDEEQRKFFEIPEVIFLHRRKDFRYHCIMRGEVWVDTLTHYPVTIYDVSSSGFGAYILTQNPDVEEGQQIELIVYLNPIRPIKLRATLRFVRDHRIGAEFILIRNLDWDEFINFLNKKYKAQINSVNVGGKVVGIEEYRKKGTG